MLIKKKDMTFYLVPNLPYAFDQSDVIENLQGVNITYAVHDNLAGQMYHDDM